MRWLPTYLSAIGRKPLAVSDLPVIASPVLGVDMAMTDRIFTDTTASTPAAHLSSVARINDAFGDTTSRWQQSSSTARPLLVTNVQAGKSALRFNGSSQYLPASGVANPGTLFQSKTFTFILVYRRPTNGFHVPFAAGSSTGGEGGAWLDNLTVSARDTGAIQVDRATGTEYSGIAVSTATFPAGQLVKLLVRCSVANGLEVTAKGTLGTFINSGSVPASADNWVWDAAFLGSGMGATGNGVPREPYNGDIFEFRFWNTRVSDVAKASLVSYMDNKWGT